MKKELYLNKSEARYYAESYAEEIPGAKAELSNKAVADDRTDFDYIDRDMNRVDCWSGELNGYVVRNEDGETIGVFAYWDEEK